MACRPLADVTAVTVQERYSSKQTWSGIRSGLPFQGNLSASESVIECRNAQFIACKVLAA